IQKAEVAMDIDQRRNHGFSGEINSHCVAGGLKFPASADAGEAVVFHDECGLFDGRVAVAHNEAGTFKNSDSRWTLRFDHQRDGRQQEKKTPKANDYKLVRVHRFSLVCRILARILSKPLMLLPVWLMCGSSFCFILCAGERQMQSTWH